MTHVKAFRSYQLSRMQIKESRLESDLQYILPVKFMQEMSTVTSYIALLVRCEWDVTCVNVWCHSGPKATKKLYREKDSSLLLLAAFNSVGVAVCKQHFKKINFSFGLGLSPSIHYCRCHHRESEKHKKCWRRKLLTEGSV